MDPTAVAGPIQQAATLLFYDWGYEFYRAPHRLRADDLLIRAKVSEILAAARARLGALETRYRQEFLPPPTRDAPFPDRAQFEQARGLARCGQMIEAIATTVVAAPAPANDFVWLRHRSEGGVLEALAALDASLIDEAVILHNRIIALDLQAASAPEFEDRLTAWLKPLRALIDRRRERLTIMV
jgi:hypothetical protein